MKTRLDPKNAYAATAAALEPRRAAIIEHFTERLNNDVARFRAKLEACGWDIEKAYPYPDSAMGRFAYQVAREDYSDSRKFTKTTLKFCRGMHDPNPVVMKDEEEIAAIIKARAEELACLLLDGYIAKLAGKQAKPMPEGSVVTSAVYEGALWQESYMTYHVAGCASEKFVWRTHCIINRSSLGKLFNQYPTRLVA